MNIWAIMDRKFRKSEMPQPAIIFCPKLSGASFVSYLCAVDEAPYESSSRSYWMVPGTNGEDVSA